MMTRPHHIFFDLDHTLWDYERNAEETILELVETYQGHFGRRLEFAEIFPIYSHQNELHWDLYRKNEIDSATLRIRRWRETFSHFGIDHDPWMDELSADFIRICPQKTSLMPQAKEVLDELHQHFPLHLITNGYLDVQKVKLACSGLGQYFQSMMTPEICGVKKPHPKIFQDALSQANCLPENALYIGDSYAEDVEGGHAAGMQVIYFNPDGDPNPGRFMEIRELGELFERLVPPQF
jgi:putative hydrolase of the HAD superfamily